MRPGSGQPVAEGGSFDAYLAGQLRNPEFRRAWEARMVVAEVAMAVRRMRLDAGLTQAGLAALIGVKQPMIARVERGSDPRTPRWDVLRRVGLALGKQLVLEFVTSRQLVPLVRVDGDKPRVSTAMTGVDRLTGGAVRLDSPRPAR